MKSIHFIAGLPRSGSTLLASLLNQNPRFRAGMTSPVAGIVRAARSGMGSDNEFSIQISDECRKRVIRAVIEAYYRDGSRAEVVFDTSRSWAAALPLLAQLYDKARVIACVRNPAWILDSVERLVRQQPFAQTRLFRTSSESFTVYSRAEALLGPDRMIGLALTALSEAYFGDLSERLILIDYESLCRRPREVMEKIYDFIKEPSYEHDFENVCSKEEAFDEHIGLNGLHDIRKKVELKPRRTVLPPDVFERFSSMAFWLNNGVTGATLVGEAGSASV